MSTATSVHTESHQPRSTRPFTPKDYRSRTLDAFSAFAELNQRIAAGLIELSSATALDSVRTLSELQTALVEAVRPATTKTDVRDPLEQEPASWYRSGLDSVVEGAQRAVKLLEKNGHILARSAERGQGSAERVSKEIRDALTAYAEKMRTI